MTAGSLAEMRIVYFSRGYGPHDHRFLAALSRTRHQVFYIRLEGDQRPIEDRPVPEAIEQVQWAGGKKAFRWGDVPELAFDLRRVFRDIRPDLVHAGPIQTCAFIAVLSGFRPILTMSWGFDLMQDAVRNAWWQWVTRYTLERSTFFTSDAQATRERAIAFGMKPERTAVFPWGVDLKLFAPARTARAPAKRRNTNPNGGIADEGPKRREGDEFMLFCNRSWEPQYGVDVLAQAFAEAGRLNPHISLILLGGGSQAQLIRQILVGGGVIDRVVFGGRIPQADLPRWYRMANVFISPSHVDGSSVSLMEALACGVPALVSDIPANREWVCQDTNGWLFPDGNAHALADKILTIAALRRTLSRIGHAARRTAEEKADWSRNFPVLLHAYEKAVELR